MKGIKSIQILTIIGLTILLISELYSRDQGLIRPQDNPPGHSSWDYLLSKYVDEEGWVDYQGFQKDEVLLDAYLKSLSEQAPNANWSREEQLAYWINAYNAFTVRLILDHYPIKSIRKIQFEIPGVYTVWHRKFFTIDGKESSLDEIEHEILRKQFDEPRIHFAIVCASISCPPLRNEAYTAEKLDAQLTDQAILFLKDPDRNEITEEEIRISRIFSWFRKDFTRKGSLIQFLNQYAPVTIQPDAKIRYMDYDWGLNSSGAGSQQ